MNGDGTSPLFEYLKKKQGGILGSFIKWNFTKFLIDTNGIPVSRYSPKTNPIVSIFQIYLIVIIDNLSSNITVVSRTIQLGNN